jgi:hypothetical protein
MAWLRRGRRLYFYQPVRIGKRVTQVYIGGGRAGEVAAEAIAVRRRQREIAAHELAAEEAQLRATESLVLELCAAATVLARATLVGQGHHQHNRGQWRLRRRWHEPTDSADPRVDPGPETMVDPRQVLGALAGLSARAEEGDLRSLGQLRLALTRCPCVWQAAADLARRVEEELIQRVSGHNLLFAECLRLRLQAVKDELGGRSPAERLLGQCLTASGVWVYHLDALTLQFLDALPTQTEGTGRPRVRLLLSLGGSAHRRHSASLRMLMRLRRLLPPRPPAFGLAGRLDRTPPRPAAAARAVAGTVPVTN